MKFKMIVLFFSWPILAKASQNLIPTENCGQGKVLLYSHSGGQIPSSELVAVVTENSSPPSVQSCDFSYASSSQLGAYWNIVCGDFKLQIQSNGTSLLFPSGSSNGVPTSCVDITGQPIPSGLSAGN